MKANKSPPTSSRNRRRLNKADADFGPTNLMMNILKGVLILFFIAISSIAQQKPTDANFQKKAEAAIIMRWPDSLPCDEDIYVQNPSGSVVYWSNKSASGMNIDRDDYGMRDEMVTLPDGSKVINNENVEYWTLRAIVPGEYIVNVHLYGCSDTEMYLDPEIRNGTKSPIPGDQPEIKPFDVSVTLYQYNPLMKMIGQPVVITMHKIWEEKQAFRFKISYDGGSVPQYEIENTTLFKSLVKVSKSADTGRFGGSWGYTPGYNPPPVPNNNTSPSNVPSPELPSGH